MEDGGDSFAIPDGAQVLIVDDDPEIRLITGPLLRAAGHVAAVAGHGAAAVGALDRHRPDTLLTDLSPGAEDGVHAARGVE